MKVIELFSQVRNTLQDNDKNYWDDSELLAYYNECKKNMHAERLEEKRTATLILDPLKETYDTSGILRYISCVDDTGVVRPLYADDGAGDDDKFGIIIESYNRIKVNSPDIGTSLTLKTVAMPNEDNLSSNVRIGDESAIKYYILSKSYEKESDMENFQKADFFYRKYIEAFRLLLSSASVNYSGAKLDLTTKSYYY